jgi:benzoyl-CoA reductase/2-hydroxyglutaryl-CoA dehydratase subunit BcrC/BadD/HgdB
MIGHCYEYAIAAKKAGRPLVGIMCEYAPRELILAAGGVPVCLCGGALETIAAAEGDLPSNLCPLIKSTYGYHVHKSNPFLEMADLLVAETTCDGKKKMFELLADSRPTYVLELPQKEDDPDALAHWTRELRKFRATLEELTGRKVSDAAIGEAIVAMNRERDVRRNLAALMKADAPPLTGRQLLDLKTIISVIPEALDKLERSLATLRTRPPDPSRAERQRVLLTGVPVVHGAEKVVELIEGHGGLVVCQENCTGLKPLVDDVNPDGDPMAALAEKYFALPCSVQTRNDARVDLLRRLAGEYRPECVIDLIWQTCLTYDIETKRIRGLAQDELGVPYLRIETDYAPSDSARLAVRIEALFEAIRGRRQA